MHTTTVYRLVDRHTGEEVSVYHQPCAGEDMDFKSPEAARRSNCHGVYKDVAKYKVRKYRVTWEVVDDAVEE